MFTLLKLELEKLFRAKSFYLSFIVLIGFVALMLWGFYTYAARKTGGQAVEQFKYTYESKQYFNGLTFALYSVLFSFTLLLPIFVSMSAGSQIAGGGARRNSQDDLHAPCLTRLARTDEVSGHSAPRRSPAYFLHWPESDSGIDLRRLG